MDYKAEHKTDLSLSELSEPSGSPELSGQSYLVAAFYQFAPIEAPEKLQPRLKTFMAARDVKGTVLLATEGLNGTISGLPENVRDVLAFLRALEGFEALEHKEAYAPEHVFNRTKVKHKKEIISLDRDVDPHEKVGTYLRGKDWNELISRDDVLVLDSRNDYEFHVGHFKNTVCPDIKNFKDFPRWVEENLDPRKHKKIATFCTGGIRCEKSTAYLLEAGFEEVYHLEGGILKYFEEVEKPASLWQGDCYVFDERGAVDHHLQPAECESECPNCQAVLTTNDRRKPQHIPGVQCVHCAVSGPAPVSGSASHSASPQKASDVSHSSI